VVAPNTVARLGGDEFVLILENVTQADAIRAVEGLGAVVATPMASPSGPINVGMSAGIAMYPAVAQDCEELLQLADAAMYQSKTKKSGPVLAARKPDSEAEATPEPHTAVAETQEAELDLTGSAAWAGRDLATHTTRAIHAMTTSSRSFRAAGIPADEKERMRALRRLKFLDRPLRLNFDRITRMTARTLNVPIALVSLVDEHRQWFMSRVGIETIQTPRDVSFCAHAILNRSPMIVPDAFKDDRFSGNPLVIGEPRIRAYAGVPVYSSDGRALGTLCVCDRIVRQFSEKEMVALDDFARVVEELFRLREFSLAYRQRRRKERAIG
jgi:hypothetical protein